MLTLFYASATFVQAWRIKNVCHKITEQLAQQASISFYALSAATEDGYDVALATSDRCVNRNSAKVTQILWLHGNQRGCCLRPLQKVPIMPWVTFPKENPIWLPFAHLHTPEELVTRLASRKDLLHLLLELDVQPCYKDGRYANIVRIEDYGKLIAWKVDSHLAVLLETDVEHYTKLLVTTFLQSNLLINDQLPLIRIESIQYEGEAQPFELVSNHLRKSTRTTAELTDEEWTKHLENLRALCVLANQAIEYEYKKNRTEAKVGVVKPDLIPPEKKQQDDTAVPTAPLTSANTKDTVVPVTTSATKTVTPSKTVEPSKSEAKKEPSGAIISPSQVSTHQMKAIPTKIKKPGAAETDLQFPKQLSVSKEKSTSLPPAQKQAGQPFTASTTSTSPVKFAPVKTSELEKLAAATVEAATVAAAAVAHQKHGSPANVATTQAKVQAQKPAASTQPSTTPTTNSTTLTDAAGSPETQATSAPTNVRIVTKSAPVVANVAKTVPSTIAVTTAVTTITTIATTTTITDSALALANGSTSATSAPVSVSKDNAKRPILQRSKDSLRDSKPLNVLVYSESASARESAVSTLKVILDPYTYTIYPMSPQQVEQKHWLDNTALIVVCGAVSTNIGEILVDYFLCGGKVLSICSDILHFVLPTYRTAEVREHELVQFSYDKWQKVKMMHHIFCYQPSPVKKNFSTDSDDAAAQITIKRQPALVCPRSIELKDLHGDSHSLEVKVLGTEETWNTPSLLLANSIKSGGKALFSQVHLETSPGQFETDETKYNILKQSEPIRLEIFADLLNKHLSVAVHHVDVATESDKKCIYQNAYFLGRYESKAELLEKLKEKTGTDKKLTTSKLIMKFCGKDDTPLHANTNVLPILIHSCPEDFSTVEYFDDLKTREIGRLVIYAPVVSSSMHVINELDLVHGIAIIARQQTEGVGRSNNQWLSPKGCAMFSLQLHVALDTPLGSRLSLIQHVVGAALVNAIRAHPTYKILDIGLKWPNDIYANGLIKIGGLIVKTTLKGPKAIVNVGVGVNLDNAKPTHCINDLITEYNRANHHNLPLLKHEQFIALMFNEIEKLLDEVESGHFDSFYKLYYKLWLHNDQTITISDQEGTKREAKIVGIDDYGYLKVKLPSGVLDTVQPDGNTFDMLKGLIVPKFN